MLVTAVTAVMAVDATTAIMPATAELLHPCVSCVRIVGCAAVFDLSAVEIVPASGAVGDIGGKI
jgi:hypothetical protein